MDCSGSMDIVDALLAAQYYVGLINQLHCCIDINPVKAITAGEHHIIALLNNGTVEARAYITSQNKKFRRFQPDRAFNFIRIIIIVNKSKNFSLS